MTGPDKFALVYTIFTSVLLVIALNVFVLGGETMRKSLDELNR